MTLSRLLSKPKASDYQQVDTFWFLDEGYEADSENEEDNLIIGQHIILDTETVSLNYHCLECDDMRTFNSDKEQGLRGVVVNQQTISIDCILRCQCGTVVHSWFLVEAESDFRNQSPRVRILHFREKLSENVKLQSEKYGEYTILLEKAKMAHKEGLGSGAVIYLRIIFESITKKIAVEKGIQLTKENGDRRSFKQTLVEVNEKHSIIPRAFSKNGYELFSKLSEIIHRDDKEEEALEYFGALETLVTGIIDNVKQTEELKSAFEKINDLQI
ncbi:MAG: hypothetical protein FWE36_06080 [Erysipelotrichales bacterium]|nr:hypothetical protein [Erysipelotrichales bacterium]